FILVPSPTHQQMLSRLSRPQSRRAQHSALNEFPQCLNHKLHFLHQSEPPSNWTFRRYRPGRASSYRLIRRRTSSSSLRSEGLEAGPFFNVKSIGRKPHKSRVQSLFSVATQLSTYPIALSSGSMPSSQDIATSPFSTRTLQRPQDPDRHP